MNSEQSHLGATPDSRLHPMTLRRQNKRREKIFYVKMAESFILLAFFVPPPITKTYKFPYIRNVLADSIAKLPPRNN